MTTPYLPAPTSGLVRFLKNDFFIAAVIAVVLSGATFALAYGLGWLTTAPNWFEVIGATINYGATYLSIKQRRFTYALGFIASAAFMIAYFQYGLLASAILSGYLVGQLIYGYFRWGPDSKSRPVHKLQAKWIPAYILATAATYAGAYFISTAFGGQFAFWDAAILVLTIAAQFLLDNKVLFAWFVWGAVNVVGVTLYFTAGAPFAAVQQLIFFFANIPGYILWRQSMKEAGTDILEESPVVAVNNVQFDPEFIAYSEKDAEMTQKLHDSFPPSEGRMIKDA
ncbi:PnuC-like nicotinamide riboside transporter [Microbacterium phage Zooman]|nr:PnuC-like nicotinamide riboside transporter [Microbacterium phage Zooman]